MSYLSSVELVKTCKRLKITCNLDTNFFISPTFHTTDLDNYPLGTLPFFAHFTGSRQSFHLMTRHAIDTTDFTKNIIEPFDPPSWAGIGISLIGLTLASFLIMKVYRNACPENTIPGLEKTTVFLKICCGLTEPEGLNITLPRSFSVGMYLHYNY